MTTYKGSCHCGRIAFEVEGQIDQVMDCNCSNCSRRGYLLWFAPRENLKLLTPEANLSTYTFNKHVIKHHFCGVCGSAPFGEGATKNGTGKVMAAINTRCLENFDPRSVKQVQVDGKSF